jgi:hypothetical protein
MLPKLKLKALVSFPSNVYGGTGIEVTKTTGNFTVDLDYSEFAKASALPPNTYTLVWDPITDSYALVPPTATGGISDAPNNGIMYGRKSAAWVDAWASPALTGTATAPTPSPGDSDNSIATTAFVAAAVLAGSGGSPSNTVPGMDGVGAAGTSALYSRGDHIHPSDTAKQAADADLTAVAALSGTGIARRTATTPTWSVGTAVTNAELAAMAAFSFKGNNSGGSAVPGDVNIASLTTKASPAGGDFLLVSDQAASGAWKKVAISTMPGSAGGIPEAPNDGQLYGRQSLGWSVVVGGGATPSGALPAMDSIANAGTSLLYARGDHVHPSDTTKADKTYVDTQDALKADLFSPTFTGDPKAPTPSPGDNDTSIATTAFVTAALTAGGSVTPAALTKVDETNITLTLGGTPNLALLQATSITAGWTGTLATGRGGFGTNASAANGVPLFNSGVVVFTATTGTGDFVRAADAVLTGNPTAPTPTPGDNDASIATTAFVGTAVSAVVMKKNYIINGAMQISQEFGSTALGSNGQHPADQFFFMLATTGGVSFGQVGVRTPGGSIARIRFTVTTADAAVGAGDYVFIVQHIEGLRIADLGFGTASAKAVTLQFGVRCPAGTYCVALLNSAENRSYVAQYVVTAGEANTDVIKSVTIPGDTAGVWLTDNTLGFRVRWGLMAGTTSQQAAGVWGTVNAVGSASQFNFMGTNGNVFELFDVSLTEGTIAPPFVVPDYASELALSRRYFQIGVEAYLTGYASASTGTGYGVVLAPPMRASPAVIATSTGQIGMAGTPSGSSPNAWSTRVEWIKDGTTSSFVWGAKVTANARL